MFIKSLSMNNFKTLKLENFQFETYNILVGPNGAGKSNLVSFFEFLGDILNDDLESAISRQGGIDNILNFNQDERKLEFEVEFIHNYTKSDMIKESKPLKIIYSATIEFAQSRRSYVKEHLNLQYIDLQQNETSNKKKSISLLDHLDNLLLDNSIYEYKEIRTDNHQCNLFNIEVLRDQDAFEVITGFPNKDTKKRSEINTFIGILESLFERKSQRQNYLFITDYYNSIVDRFCKIRTYDFDTKEPKGPQSTKSEKYLISDGSNLVNRLEMIFVDEQKKQRFLRLYKSFLPYVEDANITKTSNSYSLKINETYNQQFTPPELISDGTIGIIDIIIALYFEDTDICIIEEPEKYIHPQIIRKIANSIKDVSIYRQVLVTTHSTELLKHTEKDRVIFVQRLNNGMSSFLYPTRNEQVQEFMRNNLQLDDLFINNFLGVV